MKKKKIKKITVKKRSVGRPQKKSVVVLGKKKVNGDKRRRITKKIGWWKEIKKEKTRCLRYKKHKDKKVFCLVWAFLNKNFKVTIFSFVLLATVGVLMQKDVLRGSVARFLNEELATSLITDLTAKIKNLTNLINRKKACAAEENWLPKKEDVCDYYLYEQTNEYCRNEPNAPKFKIMIGTKLCCEHLRGNARIEGPKQNVTPCPGADIFFNKYKFHGSSLVPVKEQCGLNVCQFYPKDGFHAKVDSSGNLLRDEDGNLVIEKDCRQSVHTTKCDRDCGGGKKYTITMHKNCISTKTSEICNVKPCFTETN